MPVTSFNTKVPSWKEIQTVVKAARNTSAPGPNGVQDVPQASPPTMEDLESDLEEGRGRPTAEICRRGVGSKGGEVNFH